MQTQRICAKKVPAQRNNCGIAFAPLAQAAAIQHQTAGIR
jgi:hypothetical protein